ncbi:hypothetical protein AVEN_170446-1 [Araneus ventricosus]|uniref:CW-type domain-containing protein n=1 Tax=Araneus ventricosus TaxID=182803 RepID=A0A4Y2V5Y7_ARAVE|nr:hypothetical protein AVEN_170446-1 [Araneus ventricosus]
MRDVYHEKIQRKFRKDLEWNEPNRREKKRVTSGSSLPETFSHTTSNVGWVNTQWVAPGTSARDLLQHWNEYYMNNDFGIGIECSQCKKWRLTYQFQESKEVPTDWNCSMWKISKKKRGNCNIPSNLTEEDFALEKYPPGAMVWAKLPGFDW